MASPVAFTEAVEFFMLLFHVSVLVCILRQQAKGKPSFHSGFFTLYVIQSVADIVAFIMAFVFMRLASLGYLGQAWFNFPQGSFVVFVLHYCVNVQFVAHALIAANRFFVLSDAWTQRKLHAVLAMVLIAPVPPAALRLIGGLRLVPAAEPGTYMAVREIPWTGAAIVITATIVNVSTSFLSAYYEVRSLVVYRRLPVVAKKRLYKEFLLLVYAMLQFVIQLIVCVSFFFLGYGTVFLDRQAGALGLTMNTYASVALCVSPPVCLFSMRSAQWHTPHL